MTARLFLLSPARCSGNRARALLDPDSDLEQARALQGGDLTLGAAFRFVSGLYFRGKLAYAERFARPPSGLPGIHVLTVTRGLVPVDTQIDADTLREFSAAEIDPGAPRYRGPLQGTAGLLRERAGAGAEFVLLGSVATNKYVEPLLEVLGSALRYPREFVGRGSLSRGSLLLRSAREGRQLKYVVAWDTVDHAKR